MRRGMWVSEAMRFDLLWEVCLGVGDVRTLWMPWFLLEGVWVEASRRCDISSSGKVYSIPSELKLSTPSHHV